MDWKQMKEKGEDEKETGNGREEPVYGRANNNINSQHGGRLLSAHLFVSTSSMRLDPVCLNVALPLGQSLLVNPAQHVAEETVYAVSLLGRDLGVIGSGERCGHEFPVLPGQSVTSGDKKIALEGYDLNW
jgi:hypothetical protein